MEYYGGQDEESEFTEETIRQCGSAQLQDAGGIDLSTEFPDSVVNIIHATNESCLINPQLLTTVGRTACR